VLAESKWKGFISMPETATAEKIAITVSVNGKPYAQHVEPRMLLVEFLREACDLTGTQRNREFEKIFVAGFRNG